MRQEYAQDPSAENFSFLIKPRTTHSKFISNDRKHVLSCELLNDSLVIRRVPIRICQPGET